jgi:chemotaxis protein MotB
VEINASVLFAPGDARLSPQSVEALAAVAQVLKNDGHAIQVEGHTDNVPIGNALYPSNWELSSVRASSVVRLFIDNGVAPLRLTAIGHGANRPVDGNDTPEGRLRNRRVQLMIMSNLPDVQKDVPIEGTAACRPG